MKPQLGLVPWLPDRPIRVSEPDENHYEIWISPMLPGPIGLFSHNIGPVPYLPERHEWDRRSHACLSGRHGTLIQVGLRKICSAKNFQAEHFRWVPACLVKIPSLSFNSVQILFILSLKYFRRKIPLLYLQTLLRFANVFTFWIENNLGLRLDKLSFRVVISLSFMISFCCKISKLLFCQSVNPIIPGIGNPYQLLGGGRGSLSVTPWKSIKETQRLYVPQSYF